MFNMISFLTKFASELNVTKNTVHNNFQTNRLVFYRKNLNKYKCVCTEIPKKQKTRD